MRVKLVFNIKQNWGYLLDYLLAYLLTCCLLTCLLSCLHACLIVCFLACMHACLLAFLLTCLLTCRLTCLLTSLPQNLEGLFRMLLQLIFEESNTHTHAQTDRQHSLSLGSCRSQKLDLALNNGKPKDWYFVLYWVQFRTELKCVRLATRVDL